MAELVAPLAAIATAYCYALLVWPLLRLAGQSGSLIGYVLGSLNLAFTLLIPSDEVVGRALASFIFLDLALKMVDYARDSRRNRTAGYLDYLCFLVPFPLLLVRLSEHKRLRQWPDWREIPRAVIGGATVAAMCWLLGPIARIQVVCDNFLL